MTVQIVPGSQPQPPEPWESGFKDTVIAYPGQVTRVRMRFEAGGQFVWHCHIVEHEDNEMMRPYRIGPPDPKAPDVGMVTAGASVEEVTPEVDVGEFIPEEAVVEEEHRIYMPFIQR